MMKPRGPAAKTSHEGVPTARIGIQLYRDANGKTFRELRLPEEVFSQGTLDSLRQIPLYNGHENRKQRAPLGVARNGRPNAARTHLIMDLSVDENQRVRFAHAPKGLSGEYSCELDPTRPEELVDAYGQFDAIQRNIRYSGMALVQSPRCGPSCSLKADCAGCDGACDSITTTEENNMLTDPEASVGETPSAPITTDELERLRGENEALRAQLRERADGEQKDAAAIAAEVKRRAAKLVQAREVLPLKDHDRLDALSEDELDRRMLARLSPSLKIDAATSLDFIRGALTVALAAREKPLAAIDAARGGLFFDQASAARQRMLDRLRGLSSAKTDATDVRAHVQRVDEEHADEVAAGPQTADAARERMVARNRKLCLPR